MALELVLLAGAGLLAGYVNTIAGAGSLLTLPALVFTGLDAGAANATNRIGVLLQTIVAVATFRQGGVHVGALAWKLSIPATLGSVAGAFAATLLDDRQMRIAIAIAMVVFLVLSLVPPKRRASPETRAEEAAPPPRFGWTMAIAFAAIGFYAGFLQAGVGILVLLYMSLVHDTSLVTSNALKSVIVAVLTLPALAVFFHRGVHIDLLRGLVLGGATALGAFFGARATIERGERFVRVLMVVAVVASATKLAYDAYRGAP